MNQDLARAVGALLRLWRYQSAMTLTQVADAMGSHRPIVGRLETGKCLQTLDSLSRYARATGGDLRQVYALADAWFGFKSPSVPNEIQLAP